jgi:hypothetical protein
MNGQNPAFSDDDNGIQTDLRHKISIALLAGIEIITADTVAIFPFTGEALDTDYCSRLGHLLIHLLAGAVRDTRIDARGVFMADLHRTILERTLSIEQLFSFAYLSERTALDELALDDTIGATSEAWPLVAQIVRRGSFDLLGAYTAHSRLDPSDASVVDKLTTLHTSGSGFSSAPTSASTTGWRGTRKTRLPCC